MGFLLSIFFGFLGFLAIIVGIRSAKLAVKGIGAIFDKIENRFL